jgi:DNA-binding NtrC family response regulator
MSRVLVVDDDQAARRTLERLLARFGHDVVLAADATEAEAAWANEALDLVLLDLGLPGKDGLELLADFKGASERTGPPVIIVSARDDMRSTVTAMQRGAFDYLIKPLDMDAVVVAVERALDENDIRRRLEGIEPSREVEAGELLVGRSPSMREVYKTIAQVAQTRSTVLVTGESGTGKELVARAIHAVSADRDQPFVAVNCAALSSGVLESELFGHRRGSFTGAVHDHAGRLEAAGKGTVLLDEIGELALELQAKLLRVLQERTYERVGETDSRPFEARVVAATNRDLSAEVEAGRFREDLFYRLRVVEIRLPPLRDRLDDLAPLTERLLGRVERELGKKIRVLAPEAFEVLKRHSWPGNVRELHNVLQRATVLSRTDVITADSIALAGLEASHRVPTPVATRQRLADVEREHIKHVLEQTGWQKKKASETLGISRPTLDRKIKTYQLKRE